MAEWSKAPDSRFAFHCSSESVFWVQFPLLTKLFCILYGTVTPKRHELFESAYQHIRMAEWPKGESNSRSKKSNICKHKHET